MQTNLLNLNMIIIQIFWGNKDNIDSFMFEKASQKHKIIPSIHFCHLNGGDLIQ